MLQDTHTVTLEVKMSVTQQQLSDIPARLGSKAAALAWLQMALGLQKIEAGPKPPVTAGFGFALA